MHSLTACHWFNAVGENWTILRANSGALSRFHVLLQWPDKPRKPHSYRNIASYMRSEHCPKTAHRGKTWVVVQAYLPVAFPLSIQTILFRKNSPLKHLQSAPR